MKNCVALRFTLVLLVMTIQLARASHQVTYLSSERPPGVLLTPSDRDRDHNLDRNIASARGRDQPLNWRGCREVCRVLSGSGFGCSEGPGGTRRCESHGGPETFLELRQLHHSTPRDKCKTRESCVCIEKPVAVMQGVLLWHQTFLRYLKHISKYGYD